MHQKTFLDNVLVHRPQARVPIEPIRFERLINEELQNHQIREAIVKQPVMGAMPPGLLGGGTQRQLSFKSPVLPPYPTVAMAYGALHHGGGGDDGGIPSSAATSQVSEGGDKALAKADSRSITAPSRSTIIGKDGLSPADQASSSSSADQSAHEQEVVAFFNQLKREEQEEIARYNAENPL